MVGDWMCVCVCVCERERERERKRERERGLKEAKCSKNWAEKRQRIMSSEDVILRQQIFLRGNRCSWFDLREICRIFPRHDRDHPVSARCCRFEEPCWTRQEWHIRWAWGRVSWNAVWVPSIVQWTGEEKERERQEEEEGEKEREEGGERDRNVAKTTKKFLKSSSPLLPWSVTWA